MSTTAGSHSEVDGIGGYAYGFGSSGDRRRSQSSHDIITACAFASAPAGGINSFRVEPTLGLTSKSKSIYKIPSGNGDTYRLTNYEQFGEYLDLEDNIQKGAMTTRYGHENAPKFYAMLPLIKI